MKKFLALLLCVQLVLCTGVGLAQAAPAAQQADVVIVGGMHAGNTQVMQKWGYDETMVDMFATAIRRGVGVGQPAVYGLYIDPATRYVDWLIDCVKAAAES